MPSAVINGEQKQLTLDFEAGLTDRYSSLRDVIATGIYRRGLKRMAIELDMAPSNLSVRLSDDPSRHFPVDSLETYIEKTGDLTPIHYLIEKFIEPASENEPSIEEVIEQAKALLKASRRGKGRA